jgi:hypothetical protein
MNKPEQNQITPEHLLQKIGELTILRDIEAVQYNQKIQMLEETIKELTEKKK